MTRWGWWIDVGVVFLILVVCLIVDRIQRRKSDYTLGHCLYCGAPSNRAHAANCQRPRVDL